MSENDHNEFGGLDQGEYDALAELFLGDSTFAPPRSAEGRSQEPPREHPAPQESTPKLITRPSTSAPATVELVILGHLPIRAGLWLKEYAGTVATECEAPVGLLRLAPDIASVDLIGAEDFEPLGMAPTFADAVRRARIDASRFVLRVNETAEPALAESSTVDRVTVLTGADEAALVASYRLIKSLAAAWDRRFEIDEGPELRLAIMGSDDESSREAASKLHSAAESFLQRRVEIRVCSSRIGSTPATVLFRGESNENITDLLQMIRPSREASAPTEPAGGLRLVGQAQPVSPEQRDPEPMVMPASGQEALEEECVPEIVIPRATSPEARPPLDRAKPRVRRTTRPSVSGRLEGLTTLETVCPHSPRVEFAAAADGSLHLVTESRGAPDQAPGIERLVAAAAWARANLSLLLRVEPALALPSADRSDDHGPTLHLLISEARAARPLLDSDVRIHLTREVLAGDESVWVTDDLN